MVGVLRFIMVGSQYGYRQFLKVYPGLFSGCLVIMGISNILMHFCQRILPNMMTVFHYLGVIYILWIAWHIFRSKPVSIEETNGTLVKKPTFRTGLILNLTNMKIMIFGLTLMQMYEIPYCHSLAQSIGFTVGVTLLTSSSTLVWGYCGKLLSALLLKYYKICNAVMAALLVGCIV